MQICGFKAFERRSPSRRNEGKRCVRHRVDLIRRLLRKLAAIFAASVNSVARLMVRMRVQTSGSHNSRSIVGLMKFSVCLKRMERICSRFYRENDFEQNGASSFLLWGVFVLLRGPDVPHRSLRRTLQPKL